MTKSLFVFLLLYVGISCAGASTSPTYSQERQAKELGSPWLSTRLLTPHLVVKDPQKSKQFYRQVFGFDTRYEVLKKGTPVHVEMSYLGELVLMFVPGDGVAQNKYPERQYFYLYVEDVDSVVNKAKQANAIILEEPHKAAWGDQFALIVDPDGYHWGVAQAATFPGQPDVTLRKNTQPLVAQAPLPVASAIGYEKEVLAKASAISSRIDVIRDVAYGDDPQQRFDVFLAADVKPSSPILIFWHGGGFTNGYKEYSQFIADTVTAKGIILVTPTYRLAPQNRLPAAYDDAELLIKEVRRSAHLFSGDPDNLYLAGHSAGGSIAAMACLKMDKAFSNAALSNPVKGCLPISGIMDLSSENPKQGSLEERVYTSLLSKRTDDKLMSPVDWVKGTYTPFFLMYGGQDTERVMKSNRRMFDLIKADRNNATIEQYQQADEDHFSTHLGLLDKQNIWFSKLQEMIDLQSKGISFQSHTK